MKSYLFKNLKRRKRMTIQQMNRSIEKRKLFWQVKEKVRGNIQILTVIKFQNKIARSRCRADVIKLQSVNNNKNPSTTIASIKINKSVV